MASLVLRAPLREAESISARRLRPGISPGNIRTGPRSSCPGGTDLGAARLQRNNGSPDQDAGAPGTGRPMSNPKRPQRSLCSTMIVPPIADEVQMPPRFPAGPDFPRPHRGGNQAEWPTRSASGLPVVRPRWSAEETLAYANASTSGGTMTLLAVGELLDLKAGQAICPEPVPREMVALLSRRRRQAVG